MSSKYRPEAAIEAARLFPRHLYQVSIYMNFCELLNLKKTVCRADIKKENETNEMKCRNETNREF